jgi:hypothetical protein
MTGRASDVVEGAGRHAAWIFAREATADLARATQEWMRPENLKEATRLLGAHANQTVPIQAGHVFEFMEALKFNANAAKAQEMLHAVTTASQGKLADPVDIIISRGDETVRDVQAKLYHDAHLAAVKLSATKYDGMQRLVALDQEAEVRNALVKGLGQNPENIYVSGFRDADENLTGQLHHDGISSGGTTVKEAYEASDDPTGWLREQTAGAMANETLKAAAIGAAGGAVFGAAAHSLQLALRARHGAIGISESVVEVATVAATAGLRSGLTSGLATVVEIGARNSEIFSPLAKTTAPVAVASAVVSIGEAAYQYATGAIDRQELIDRCGEVALRNTGAWAFGVVGQTLIPIPVVGALVGSTVGYATSTLVLEGFKLARVAAAAADAAEDRLRELETEVFAAIKTMEEHRLTLEALIEQEAKQYRDVLVPLMDGLEQALTAGEDLGAMNCLVTLSLELGEKLEWSSLPQFDEFMSDTQRSLQL